VFYVSSRRMTPNTLLGWNLHRRVAIRGLNPRLKSIVATRRGDSNPAVWWVGHVMIHPSLRDDEGCVGCPCRGSEIRGRGPLVVRWSSQPCVCRVAATEFSRGFQPTDRVAPHIGSRRVATDECHPSGICAGGTPALPGVPAGRPRSQGFRWPFRSHHKGCIQPSLTRRGDGDRP